MGHSLVPRLVAEGYRVRAMVRSHSEVGWLHELGVELVPGDVRDRAAVKEAVQGCRHVIHAAGRFRLWGPDTGFEDTNVHGTQHLLDAATREEVERFIHVSTVVVVGRTLPDRVIDEARNILRRSGGGNTRHLCAGA